jgi:hypothetical protein
MPVAVAGCSAELALPGEAMQDATAEQISSTWILEATIGWNFTWARDTGLEGAHGDVQWLQFEATA